MNLYFCRDIEAYWPLQNGLEYLFDLSKLLSEKNMFKPYTQKVKRAVSVYELWYCLIVQIFFFSFIFHRNKVAEFYRKVWWFGVGQNINQGNPERLFISIEIQYDMKILVPDVNLCGRG